MVRKYQKDILKFFLQKICNYPIEIICKQYKDSKPLIAGESIFATLIATVKEDLHYLLLFEKEFAMIHKYFIGHHKFLLLFIFLKDIFYHLKNLWQQKSIALAINSGRENAECKAGGQAQKKKGSGNNNTKVKKSKSFNCFLIKKKEYWHEKSFYDKNEKNKIL
ncbi:hypothetical protein RFI_38282 [Reticulomyxa filosa]|uniref:Uncharacterized protein n=1 Tax=Reticulomyxa filosa TaxID=46433 RepID=X6LCC3_RETFI|nr:hypothetical protein RFI_38282 [Reticulomyxa filosa]|eukprot:ETN99198.1 hypothetical protein RFI_38282 [Reticulomyxa filosa]